MGCRQDETATEGARVIRRTKRTLVVGGAALAIVGGGGAALAAGGDGLFGSSERQAFLDDAAGKLNVKSADLEKALQQAYEDRIDAAVKAGKLTQAQADDLKARAKANGGGPLPLPGGARPPRPRLRALRLFRAGSAAA